MTDEGPGTTTPARAFRHTVERKKGSLAVVSVEVEAERLSRAADRVFERHVKQARIPGFRPGKAPRAIYERTYGTEHLWAEAAEDLIDETYREIVQLEDLRPLDRPTVDVGRIEPGRPLTYTASVAVTPEVRMGEGGPPRPSVEPKPVTEEDVERTLQSMREAHAEARPVDRPAAKGDILTVDIDVTMEGREMPPLARNAHLEAGGEYAIAGLGDGLVGLAKEQERSLELTFPADHPTEEVRGKQATFRIRASQVAEKVLPALDDELAKTVGTTDLETLRRAVRNELAHAAFHEARDAAADALLESLLASAEVEVPEVLVQDELDHMLGDLRARVEQQGLKWEQFLVQARKSEGEIREEWRPTAERRAKSLLVLDAAAKRENVTVSGEELAREVAMTPLAQQDARALRDPAVLSAMARSLRNRKVVDKLLGLDAPDAERELIRKAGGTEDAVSPHEPAAAPEIAVPLRTGATAEGREAIRALAREEREKQPE